MARKLISTGSPFERQGGYSRAVVDGGFVFVAGTTGYDYATMTIPADIESQTRNIFATIEKTLREAGCGLKDVVRVTYLLVDRADIGKVFPIFGEVFGDIRPASTLFVVAGLMEEAMRIEIEVTALIPQAG